MKRKQAVLGIDTSCYTTSIAALDLSGKLLEDRRIILSVKNGECGLRQSEMLFQHTRNLPELFEKMTASLELIAIGTTNKPRPLEESYMPAFLAGFGYARSLSALLEVPLVKLSHQENHLHAGIYSAGGPIEENFLFLHASGGTTDILSISTKDKINCVIEPVGGSSDLHAGQFVDRVGVALGLGFPAGPCLETLAAKSTDAFELPVSVHKNFLSFSGPATAAQRAAKSGIDAASLAKATEVAIGETFYRVLKNICLEKGIAEVLLAGGVAANHFIRELTTAKLAKKGIKVYAPEPKYCGDNAVGAAVFAWKHLYRG